MRYLCGTQQSKQSTTYYNNYEVVLLLDITRVLKRSVEFHRFLMLLVVVGYCGSNPLSPTIF